MRKVPFIKIWGLFLLVFVLALSPARSSSAASASTTVKKPGFVRSVKASNVSGTKATLTWSRASNAAGYCVYSIDPVTGKREKCVKWTTSCSCTLWIIPGELYTFQIYAYCKSGKKFILNEEGSPPVDVQSDALRFLGYGKDCAYLGWDKLKDTAYFVLYVYNPTTKKFKIAKAYTGTTTSCQVEVPEGATYKYMLRSVRKVNGKNVYSKPSNIVSVKGKELEAVHGRYWAATLKKDLKVKDPTTGKQVTLKKGTQVTTKACTGDTTWAIVVKTNKAYKLSGSNLSYSNLYLAPSYDYYNQKQSEKFINSNGYSSKTDYLVWISQYTASIHFFKGSAGHWKEQSFAPCIIGTKGHTKVGEYEILELRDAGHVYFYWNPTLGWGQSFHGWVDSNRWGAYSSGCIRLESDVLNYVRSLPVGTKVVSY